MCWSLVLTCDHSKRQARGFTLVELVIVILIVGILAAMAAPRILNVTERAEEAALDADLRVLREALDMYALEHGGKYPGSLTALARYTSEAGAMSSNRTAVYYLGKYIKRIPPCPIGSKKGATGWGACPNPPTAASGSASVGWLYHSASGGVWVNDAKYFDR